MAARSDEHKDLPENMLLEKNGMYRYMRWHKKASLSLTLSTKNFVLACSRHRVLSRFVERHLKKGTEMMEIKRRFRAKKFWKDGGKIGGHKNRSAAHGTNISQPERTFPARNNPGSKVVDKASPPISVKVENMTEDDPPKNTQVQIPIDREGLEILEMVVAEAITPTVLFTGDLEEMRKEATKIKEDNLQTIKKWVEDQLKGGRR